MEINKETFTIKDLKQLLKEAFEFDYDKHKGKVKFLPLTIVEWHKSDVFKKRLSLHNINGNVKEWRMPFKYRGVYFHKEKSAIIFLRGSDISLFLESGKMSLDELIISCIITAFHELSHYYQYEFMDYMSDYIYENNQINSYSFFYDIDYIVMNNKPQYYYGHHDEFRMEIDANLYGVERAYDFLKSKGMLSEEIEAIFQKYRNKYLFNLNNYDIHSLLLEAHKFLIKGCDSLTCYRLFYDFINKRLRYVGEILYHAERHVIDDEILMLFFSSKDFLDSLNFIFLSKKNKQIIINSIEYALELEINRRKKNKEFLQNKQITAKQYLDVDAKICSKIAYFNKKLERMKKTIGLSNINETTGKTKK